MSAEFTSRSLLAPDAIMLVCGEKMFYDAVRRTFRKGSIRGEKYLLSVIFGLCLAILRATFGAATSTGFVATPGPLRRTDHHPALGRQSSWRAWRQRIRPADTDVVCAG